MTEYLRNQQDRRDFGGPPQNGCGTTDQTEERARLPSEEGAGATQQENEKMTTSGFAAQEIPLRDATNYVLGRLQIRAMALDIIGDECGRREAAHGTDILRAIRERFGNAMDNQDFYTLRRQAWNELLGKRPPGSHKTLRSQPRAQGVLTTHEVYLLGRRERAIAHCAAHLFRPFSFTALVSEALCDVVESDLVVDGRGRIVTVGPRRPEVIAFPRNPSINRFSRTFSVRENLEFWADQAGRRRAWSSRESADEAIDQSMGAPIGENKHTPDSGDGPDLQAETYQLAAFPDPAQVDPERAAAESRVGPPQEPLISVGSGERMSNRAASLTERWWADRVRDAKKASRPMEGLVEIRLKPDAPATILQAILEALGGLTSYTSTDEDGYIVVIAS